MDNENKYIDKVNIKDKKILIFEKIGRTDFYAPVNENALNYLKKEYLKYKEEKLYDIEYTEFDKDELTRKNYEVNLIGTFLDKITVKNKGLLKLNKNTLVYLNTKDEPTPLDENSSEKQDKILKLVTMPPSYCKKVWLKLNSSFKEYFSVIK